jgi:hypothetical protein
MKIIRCSLFLALVGFSSLSFAWGDAPTEGQVVCGKGSNVVEATSILNMHLGGMRDLKSISQPTISAVDGATYVCVSVIE